MEMWRAEGGGAGGYFLKSASVSQREFKLEEMEYATILSWLS